VSTQSYDNTWVTVTGGTCTNLELIQPSEETNFDAGNILTARYKNLLTGLTVLRTMDLTATNNSNIRDYADIHPYAHLQWRGNVFPMQALAEIANEVSVDLWLCIPHQSTDACVSSMMADISTHIDVGSRVYVEYANEVWNFASGFTDAAHWVDRGDISPVSATVVPATATVTSTAHGLTTGDEIRCFNNQTHTVHPYAVGAERWAIVDDVNTFRLASSNANALAGTDDGVIDSTVTELWYKPDTSVKSQATNYAERCVAVWDLAQTALGSSVIYKVGSGQFANPAAIVTHMGVAGYSEGLDFYATAPYFHMEDAPDFINQTNQFLTDYMVDNFDSLGDVTTAINNLDSYKLICYEAGNHSITFGDSAGAAGAKKLEWARDAAATDGFDRYYRKLSSLGFSLTCQFVLITAHGETTGVFGLLEDPDDTLSKQYLGFKVHLDAGGASK